MRCVKILTSHHEFAWRVAAAAMVLAVLMVGGPVRAQQPRPDGSPKLEADVSLVPPHRYSSSEIIDAGHHFFSGISKGIASVVEKAADQWGQPNGYILGEEAGGEFVGGLRYGEGTYTPRMPVTYGCSGRDQQSELTLEPMAREP